MIIGGADTSPIKSLPPGGNGVGARELIDDDLERDDEGDHQIGGEPHEDNFNFNVALNEYGLKIDSARHRESTGIIGQKPRNN